MILLDRFWSMHVFHEDPFIVTLRKSLPLDQVLKASLTTSVPVAQDSFNFLLRFPIYDIRWGPGEVRPMFQSFLIWR
jgi:hypothetical protein